MHQKAHKPDKAKKTNEHSDKAQENLNNASSQSKFLDPDPFTTMLKSLSVPYQGKEDSPIQPKTSGTQMPVEVQTKMEGAFNTNFSQVNVFKDDESATQMGAQAYTQGSNIHFAPGKYEPETKKGQELLGHELTHVEQQRNGKVKAMPKLADIQPLKKSGETLAKEQQHNEMWGAQMKSAEEQMQLKLKYGSVQLKKEIARTKYQHFKSNTINQLKRDRQDTRLFQSKAKQFENALIQKKTAFGSDAYIQLAAKYFPGQDFSADISAQPLQMAINDSPALEKEADIMGKKAADGKNAEISSKGNGIQKKEDNIGDGKQYGFLHDKFKWRMDGNTSFAKAAGILRHKFGIGLSFPSDEEFGIELIRSNKLTGTYEDKPSRDVVLEIPSNELLPDDMYSSSGFDATDLTIKEIDAQDAMNDMERARKAKTLATSDKKDLQLIEDIAKDFRTIINNKELELKELYAASNKAGRKLWTYCATNVDAISSVEMLLFVGRNLMRSYIKETTNPNILKDKRHIPHLIFQLEQGSRNLDQYIPDEANTFIVLLAGFDPFEVTLAPNFVLNNSNTASFFALKYNEKTFEVNGKKVKFHTQIFPVTGSDFEEGVVEGFYGHWLNKVDMVINTGIADRIFEIEGRAQNEYSTYIPDNNDDTRGGTGQINPAKPIDDTHPNTLISRTEYNSSALSGLSNVIYDDAGTGATAGDFYCNEMFYRVSELTSGMRNPIPNGFIHLPGSAFTDNTLRSNLVPQFHQILMEILKLRVR